MVHGRGWVKRGGRKAGRQKASPASAAGHKGTPCLAPLLWDFTYATASGWHVSLAPYITDIPLQRIGVSNCKLSSSSLSHHRTSSSPLPTFLHSYYNARMKKDVLNVVAHFFLHSVRHLQLWVISAYQVLSRSFSWMFSFKYLILEDLTLQSTYGVKRWQCWPL